MNKEQEVALLYLQGTFPDARVGEDAMEWHFSSPEGSALIHNTAKVGSDCEIGEGCVIEPYVTVENGACLNEDVVLAKWSYVSAGARIGESTMIHEYAFIGSAVRIGNHVRVYPHATIHACTKVGFNASIGTRAVVGSRAAIGNYAHVKENTHVDPFDFVYAPFDEGNCTA